MIKLSKILFIEGKKVWYGAQNRLSSDKNDVNLRSTSDVRASFDLSEFKKLYSIEEKLEYLRNSTMYIGSGSSRIVFAISPKKVIKLVGGNDESPDQHMRYVYYPIGREQNKIEYSIWQESSPGMKELLPKIYEADKNFDWLLTELVRPIRSDIELQILMGLTKAQYSNFMEAMINMQSESYKKFYESLASEQRKRFDVIEQLIKKFDMQSSDLTGLEQWGKTSDGRLVILDTGATKEFFQKHFG